MTGVVSPVRDRRDAQSFRSIGTTPLPKDARDKIAGETRYAADFVLPDQLHARLVRSVMPSARITRRDASLALALPGVVAVLFGEDVPNNEVAVDVPGQQVAVEGLRATSQTLATDRVRYHGEPIALIVGTGLEVLDQAEGLVEVEYEELPVQSDPEHALDAGAPLVHASGNLNSEWWIDDGDIDVAFATADVVVEGEYHCQAVDPGYLEPEAGVAWMDDDGVITIRA